MKFCQCYDEKRSMCLPLPNGSAKQLKRIGSMSIVALEQLEMVGDHERDIIAGTRAGLKTIRLAPEGEKTNATFVVRDLLEASKLILNS